MKRPEEMSIAERVKYVEDAVMDMYACGAAGSSLDFAALKNLERFTLETMALLEEKQGKELHLGAQNETP